MTGPNPQWPRLFGIGIVVAAVLAAFYTAVNFLLLGRIITAPPVDVIVRWQLLAMAPWAVMVPAAAWLAQFTRPGRTARWSSWLLHATLALLMVLTHMLWFAWISVALEPFEILQTMAMGMNHFLRYHFGLEVVLYGVIAAWSGRGAVMASVAAEERRRGEVRAAALRMQLADAQLRALRLQVQPHFLFNILNTVAMMIRTGDTAEAQKVVTLLGGLFRRFLEVEYRETLTLAEELGFLDQYLALEQFRFADRMQVRRRVDDSVLDAEVPALILQPIVENAVKHGVARIEGATVVDVIARRDGIMLVVEVVNDEPPETQRGDASLPGTGIGVVNTLGRLRESFGELAAFELLKKDGRMHATMRMPYREGQSAEHDPRSDS